MQKMGKMGKMGTIARREMLEEHIKSLKGQLEDIQKNCEDEVIILYKNANYYWVEAKCLLCGKKIGEMYVLKNKKNVVNADLECLLSNESKYKVVKEKYIRIKRENPEWTAEQIVAEIQKELNSAQNALEQLKKANKAK